MERETGIEPATSSLGSWRSTAELLPLAWIRALADLNQPKSSIRDDRKQSSRRPSLLLMLIEEFAPFNSFALEDHQGDAFGGGDVVEWVAVDD